MEIAVRSARGVASSSLALVLRFLAAFTAGAGAAFSGSASGSAFRFVIAFAATDFEATPLAFSTILLAVVMALAATFALGILSSL